MSSSCNTVHLIVAQAVKIGIGGRIAPPPLPHHRTYGSIYGGSIGYASDPQAMTEVLARRELHWTGRCPEPGSGLHATDRDDCQRCSPPVPRSRPAAPVPQTVTGRNFPAHSE